MKFSTHLNAHFVPQFTMGPKGFADNHFENQHLSLASSEINEVHSPFFHSLTYAEVVKLVRNIPRMPHLSSVPVSTMLITATERNAAPQCKSPSSPNNKTSLKPFSWPIHKPPTAPRTNLNPTPWRARRPGQQEINNQRQNCRNKVKDQQIPIANYNWRMPSPSKSQEDQLRQIKVVVSPISEIKFEDKMESPEIKTENSALCESKHLRIRYLSESSQASEDSVVTFDRCSYESEISSDEYEGSEDEDDDTISEDEGCTTTPANSSASESEDSGSEDDMDAGPILQVGNNAGVHLPLEPEVPPPQRLRSQSQSSFTSDYDDSDDDFIVFSQVSGEEEEESEDEEEEVTDAASQLTPVHHRRRRPERVRPAVLKVQFSDNDEICPLYDDDDFRDARVGQWEEVARDRSRFRHRIATYAAVIGPILEPEHRLKMLEKIKKMQEVESKDSHVKKQAAEKVSSNSAERRPVCVH